ncbi:ABC transporter permease [Synechocystis sp. PCC 7509]|uniref:ABC transporter permease n=1 Tax=Synechocystis sp. PCC 7509 TaxID=927677 RepID=UPI0002AD09AB|nr:ABC-2 type transporter [Synechocystis sp. PCC 7509]
MQIIRINAEIVDIWTVIWKEWRELLFSRGNLRAILLSLLPSVLIFGVLLPAQVGRVWVDSPVSMVLWGWLSMLPVTAIIADAFAGERERHTLETLLASPLSETAILFGKVGAAVGYAWLLALIMLLAGLITVNIVDGGGILLYPVQVAFSGGILGLLTATLSASTGVLVSLRAATVKQAAQQLVFASIALTWLPLFGLSLLPTRLQESLILSAKSGTTGIFLFACVVLIGLDFGLLMLAISRFKRSRLILD